jgi:hypothetical protein
MAPKANKNRTPEESNRIAKRIEFVQAHPDLTPLVARQRFFVQTRAAELTSKGVDVTPEKRKQLRQGFDTGKVKREGFYTAGDIARIAAKNKGGDGTQDITKPVVSKKSTGGNRAAAARSMPGVRVTQTPQSLAETKADSSMTGVNKWINEKIAKPEMAAIQSFNQRNIKQFGSGTPLIVRTAGGITRGIGGVAMSTGESFNATFVNPAVNLIGGLFGKKPNLRQAGPLEATINTADAIATIGSLGGSKIITSVLKAGGEVAAEKLSQRGLARTSMAIDKIIARTGGTAETLVSAANSTPKPGKSYAGPKAPGGKSKAGEVLYERNQKSFYNDIVSGKGPSYQAAPSSTFKATDVLSTTKVKPAKVTKPKATEISKPTSTRASKSTAAQARADKLIEGGLSKVAPKSSTPNMNASSLSSMESTAPVTKVSKPKGPKVSPAKAKAGAGVKAKMEQAKAAPVRSTVTPKTTVASFKSQAEYDTWMSAGGKFHIQNMAPAQQQSFLKANQKFIAARGARKTAVTTTESKVVARNVKFKGRYDRAAKRGSEMYPLANKLIAARRAAK